MGLRVICCLLLLGLAVAQGGVIPAGVENALYKAINTFLANPVQAASALGLSRVKRDVGDGNDNILHFKAVGIEVQFGYHKKGNPLDGGKLSLNLDESVVAGLVPLRLKNRLRLGKVNVAVDFKNLGTWFDDYFRLEVEYEIEHHGYNEKGLFTIFRDDLGNNKRMVTTKVDVMHSSLPPQGQRNLIPKFMLSLNSDHLTYAEGKYVGPNGVEHTIKSYVDLDNKLIKFNANKNGFELNWKTTADDWIRCRAVLTAEPLYGNYVADFYIKRKAIPSIGLNVLNGPRVLFALETKGAIEPNIVSPKVLNYDIRFNTMGLEERKLTFTWEFEQKENSTGAILSKDKITIQHLPQQGQSLTIFITPEKITSGIRITANAIEDNEKPLFDTVAEITDYSKRIRSGDYELRKKNNKDSIKLNMTTNIHSQNLQKKLGFSTSKVQGEAMLNPVELTASKLYLEVTNDSIRKFLYKLKLDFPYGINVDIYDPIFLHHFLCYVVDMCTNTIQISSNIDFSTPHSALRSLVFSLEADDFLYSLTGDADTVTDLEKDTRSLEIYILSNLTNSHNYDEGHYSIVKDMKVDLEITPLTSTLEATLNPFDDLKIVFDTNFENYFKDTSLNVYYDPTRTKNIVSLCLTGDFNFNSNEDYIKYDLNYNVAKMGEGLMKFSWEDSMRDSFGAELSDMRVSFQYLPKAASDVLIMIKPKLNSTTEFTNISLVLDVTCDGEPLLDSILELNHQPGYIEKLNLSFTCNDKKYSLQRFLNSIKATGSLHFDADNPLLFYLEAAVIVDGSDPVVYKINTLISPYEVKIIDAYLLPKLYQIFERPQKNSLNIKIVRKDDIPNLQVVLHDDFYVIYGPQQIELRHADETLAFLKYDHNSVEIRLSKLPGDQHFSVKASRHHNPGHVYELQISGFGETHDIKLSSDFVSGDEIFRFEAKGHNYWLGRYDFIRELHIYRWSSGRNFWWTGMSMIENAPWPSPVYTHVDYIGGLNSFLSSNTSFTICKKAFGVKFSFGFSDGRPKLHITRYGTC